MGIRQTGMEHPRGGSPHYGNSMPHLTSTKSRSRDSSSRSRSRNKWKYRCKGKNIYMRMLRISIIGISLMGGYMGMGMTLCIRICSNITMLR